MKWAVIQRKLKRVERALDKAIDSAEIPGAVVHARMPHAGERVETMIVRGRAVLRPEPTPMAADTIFDLASLTKPMVTTTAILQLVGEGIVALDDPVAKHLPPFADRDKEEVTLRHLLTHSSGLKPWRAFHELLIERERKTMTPLLGTAEGRAWVLDRVQRSGLVHEPGTAAVYGDLDFIVLGALVEAVSQLSLDEYFRKHISGPLGLADTFFLPLSTPSEGVGTGPAASAEATLRRRIAATENCAWRGRVLWGEVHDPNAWAMGGVAGHAGLFSTAADVMQFAQTLLDVWHGRSEALPRELLKEFFRRQDLPADSDWALGWDTPTPGASSSGSKFSPNSVGHLGFTGTSLWIDLESEAIVVMLTNRVHLVAKKSKFELRPVIHDLVIDAFLSG
jgi:CubicO group peptidase (beta-lactamase class C family)